MRVLLVTVAMLCLSSMARAAGAPPKVDFGVFVDSYYGFDANQPTNRERAFHTTGARHDEFAVNLAYLEGKITADELRGRVALQTGTSVLANDSGEYRDPAKTGVQLADVLMLLQEAYAGYRLADGLWIDGGIFFSHIGSESFISKENWTYTRSLVADFSPYYQAGVRATYELSPRWSVQLDVLNGWQNVVETNGDKSIGTQVVFHPTKRLGITYNTLIGRESEVRLFQDLFATYECLPWWKITVTVDLGLQKRRATGDTSSWYGASLINRFQVGEKTAVAARLEGYRDPDGVIVPTGTAGNFQAWGASVNLDQELLPRLLWRNEARYLRASDPVFPSSRGKAHDTIFGVTSLALSL